MKTQEKSLFKQFLDESPNKLKYLMELSAIQGDWESLDITEPLEDVEWYDISTEKSILEDEYAKLAPEQAARLIRLSTKYFNVTYESSAMTVVFCEFMDGDEKSSVLLMRDGGRISPWEYEGYGFDQGEMADALEMNFDDFVVFWEIAYYEFRPLWTMFCEEGSVAFKSDAGPEVA